MKWFGRKAGRLAARPFLLRGWPAAAWEPWPRSYEAQVREAYLGNPVAQRAVRLVAEGCGGASVYGEGEGGLSASSGRAALLVRSGLLETAATQLLLHGNAFLQILIDAEGEPAELFPLRPERVGARRFLLSRLLRGRRGTEWAAEGHRTGEPFLVLDADALKALPSAGNLDAEIKVMASSIGDLASPAIEKLQVKGRALEPPAPVHLRAEPRPGGDIHISWVRRSRSGWMWTSGSDTPLGEEAEVYRLQIAGAGFVRAMDLTAPEYVYTVPQQTADRAARPLSIEVRQLGTRAASRPTATILLDQLETT